MSSKNLSLILSILLAGLILPFLLSQIDINLFFETLNIINPIYILFAFLSYFSTYLLRTWRFCILTNKEIKFLDMLKIVCIHNMFNNLLPARTGELSFIYLLRKFHKKDLEEGFAILLAARVFDGLSILFLFLISAFLVGFEMGIIFYILSIPIFTLMLSFKFIKNLNLAVNSNNKFLSLLLEVLKKILDGFRSIKLGKAELT
ncbi:MAG: lysylphosphatidylglycerol synthase transmembrane domain-containing protein, partial [Candidatus Micrarchaeia archaeon]